MVGGTLYLLIKYLHIVLMVFAVGFNFSYVVWTLRGEKDPTHLAFALKGVKFIDDYLANPCYIGVAITGFAMVAMGKKILPFLWLAIALYAVAMVVAYVIYTPLLRRQLQTLEADGPDSQAYKTLSKRSSMVGASMGGLVLIILVLKVLKPSLHF